MGKQSWLIIDVAKNNPLVPFLSILKQFASRIPQIFIISPNDTPFNQWAVHHMYHVHSLTQDIPAINLEHWNCHSFSRFLYSNQKIKNKFDARMVWAVELVSKELNHLGAILHVYAGGLIFMK